MIDIDTHKIIDLIESREEEAVTEWLKTYPNLNIISRDGGIVYKQASSKAHPKAEQISDRFHILKNLTEYAKNALKRILKNQINIKNDRSKKTETSINKKHKTKWDVIEKVQELRKQKYRVVDIAKYLGIGESTVIHYSKIPLEDKNKYNKLPIEILKSEASKKEKWELIQKVQAEYKKCPKYKRVARKFNLDRRTVRNYLKMTEPPVNSNKDRVYASKLNIYKNKIIEMNNKGYSWKIINESIRQKGYNGSDSLLRKYLAKVKEEKIEGREIKHTIGRSSMISLLYKEIDKVQNLTQELVDKVISMFPEAKKIYETVKKFKEVLFSKEEAKLYNWIISTKELDIPEFNSFIYGIERDLNAVRNGIKYRYSNGLAEGSVNKIKLIKRTMYGRCNFELLKQKILLQY